MTAVPASTVSCCAAVASRRMGRDKALIEVDGGPDGPRGWPTRSTAAGAAAVVASAAIGRRWSASGLGPSRPVAGRRGPLGAWSRRCGMSGGTRPSWSWPAISSDPTPRSSPTCRGGRAGTGVDVTVPVVDGRPQWLHAAWHRGRRRRRWRRRSSRASGRGGRCERLRVEFVDGGVDRGRRRCRPPDRPAGRRGHVCRPGPPVRTIGHVDIPEIDIETLVAALGGRSPGLRRAPARRVRRGPGPGRPARAARRGPGPGRRSSPPTAPSTSSASPAAAAPGPSSSCASRESTRSTSPAAPWPGSRPGSRSTPVPDGADDGIVARWIDTDDAFAALVEELRDRDAARASTPSSTANAATGPSAPWCRSAGRPGGPSSTPSPWISAPRLRC